MCPKAGRRFSSAKAWQWFKLTFLYFRCGVKRSVSLDMIFNDIQNKSWISQEMYPGQTLRFRMQQLLRVTWHKSRIFRINKPTGLGKCLLVPRYGDATSWDGEILERSTYPSWWPRPGQAPVPTSLGARPCLATAAPPSASHSETPALKSRIFFGGVLMF